MSQQVELSRLFKVEDAANQSRQVHIEATGDECEALARRFNIPAIIDLRADLQVKPDSLGLIVTGEIFGHATQNCVVTLNLVEEEVKDTIETYFILSEELHKIAPETEEDPEFDKDYEELTDSYIDLGELVAQHFALALTAYPRAENAEKEAEKLGKPHNPFEVLAKLKEKG
ncbi:MAG: hypothetical protein PVF65_02080 [Sphingomonadales bacterium]|jgi:hypothetical protein